MSLSCIRDIFKGASFLDPEHFEAVQEAFMKQLLNTETVEDFVNRCRNCQNDLERISIFEKYFEWIPIPQKYFTKFTKTKETSIAFRQVGNTAYNAEDISNAFRGYNLALAFAPTGSEEEGLAYSNRSALLMFTKHYELAIIDLNFALKFKLNETVLEKILARKVKCEALIKAVDIKSKQTYGIFEQIDYKHFWQENFSKLPSAHKWIIGAADCVEIGFSPECGRKLLVNKDILAGTPIILDKGFVTVLDRMLNWDTEHCAFCTKPILSGIPNPCTTFGLYCNQTCLDKSMETVSKYEHNYLPYLQSTKDLYDESLLILRIVAKPGPKELYNMWKSSLDLHKNDSSSSNPKHGLETHSQYDPTSYQAVYSLIPHKSITDLNNFRSCKEFKSLFLIQILSETTDFFENCGAQEDLKFKSFLSSLILRHYESLEYNVLSLCEWRTTSGPLSQPLWVNDAKSNSKETKTCSYGTGVYPLVALCNHSCDPNSIFVKGTKVDFSVLLSSRKIRKGEEILISYKAPFTRMQFEDRQDYLLKNYKFICQCFACINKLSVHDIVVTPTFTGINDELCSNSQGFLDNQANVKRLLEAELELEEVKELIRNEKFEQAYDSLVKEANFLSNFQSNFKLLQICQDLFRTVAVHIMHL